MSSDIGGRHGQSCGENRLGHGGTGDQGFSFVGVRVMTQNCQEAQKLLYAIFVALSYVWESNVRPYLTKFGPSEKVTGPFGQARIPGMHCVKPESM